MSWVQPVRIPADVEQEDKILAGFTARQVLILGGTGALLYAGYLAFGERLPLPAVAAITLPVAIAGILLAVGRHDGISLDRYLLAALRHRCAPRRLVTMPGDIPAPPAWIGVRSGPLPAPLRLPARGVGADGLIDLGDDGMTVIAEVSTVSFALRTPEEQDALVAVFGRWLNSLSGPVQILVRAERVDLTATIAGLRDRIPELPHPALVHAAREHAAFLTDLSARHDLLRRQVLLIVREPAAGGNGRASAAARALRRMDEASRVLSACGLVVKLLDARDVTALLASCFDPAAPPLPDAASSDQVITAGGEW
ncbi:PrgI family protein [Planobispora rosea]|uniref:PrgI family protein n=1 Tax=Planobispora rosea TaxID=35762 RepID=UPI000839F471|nr:PrgI family protein [Planobispora rosea]